nr:hypothetical protein [Pseudoalteromonas sp. A25]
MRYRRNYVAGGTYFFTVNLLNRNSALLVEHIGVLRESVRWVKQRRPFYIDAWVVLPDHLHAVLTLPDDGHDYSNGWCEIKKRFSKSLPKTELLTDSHKQKASAAFGNGVFGNIPFVTSVIIGTTLITFILTP